MHEIMEFFRKWAGVLTKPSATLKKESRSKKLNEAIIHILVAGVIAGVVSGFFGGPELAEAKLAFGGSFAIMMVILTPLFFAVFWFISAAVFYLFARLLGGKGDFVPHAHIIAIINAPFAVANAIVSPVPTVGYILGFLLSLYSLYVLTVGFREVHKYPTTRAVLTWLLPLLILIGIVILLALALTGRTF